MPIDDELQWQAFRFIANEMTPEEVRKFEQRLATDEAACEAVAQSVLLTHALIGTADLLEPAIAPHNTSAPHNTANTAANTISNAAANVIANTAPHRNRRRLGWVWAATVSAALVVCTVFLVGRQDLRPLTNFGSHPSHGTASRRNGVVQLQKSGGSTDRRSAGADGLIGAWLDLRNSLMSEENTAEIPGLNDDGGVETRPITPDSLVEQEGEFDWMVAAVDAEMPQGMSEAGGTKEEKN